MEFIAEGNSTMRVRVVLALLSGLYALPVFAGWSSFSQPTQEPPEPIGGYANGCMHGGVALPLTGEGYQVIRTSRNRYYGQPEMVEYLTRLGHRARQNGLGDLLIGDIAMPRGGRFNSGHSSHQTGLDADIWLRMDVPSIPAFEREELKSKHMVNPDLTINSDNWSEQQVRLLQLAADDSRVSRIFVNPAIKKALCMRDYANRNWLNKIRPWYGHDEHIHVRLHCPEGAAACVDQPVPPVGDGCDEELASWFPDPDREPVKVAKRAPKPRPVLPDQCMAMLKEADNQLAQH